MSSRTRAHSGFSSRTAQLREAIHSSDLAFLMEAHNGVSAKIVEEAGFQGIWASGLTISASLGLRDSNEASWTQVLEVLEFMNDSTRLPILVDGDTGHGNFNNLRRFVRKLGERGIAGVCVEDKLFPKTNSFVGEGQPLADIDEFCGKIKAGKDSQLDDDFVFVARVEALIAGMGMAEALKRAEAYHSAGADAILIHSKQKTATEIMEFARHWAARCPLLIVPTTYYSTATDDFRTSQISTVIWANHLLRSAVVAMRQTAEAVKIQSSTIDIESKIASVAEIFRLADNDELRLAESKYLPNAAVPHAVVLHAGRETETSRMVDALWASGIRRIGSVASLWRDTAPDPRVRHIKIELPENVGEARALYAAKGELSGELLLSNGKVVCRRYIVDALLAHDEDIVLAVDASEASLKQGACRLDAVAANRQFWDGDPDDVSVQLRAIGPTVRGSDISGRWIGFAKFSSTGSSWLRAKLEELKAANELDTTSLADVLSRLNERHSIRVIYFKSHWVYPDGPVAAQKESIHA